MLNRGNVIEMQIVFPFLESPCLSHQMVAQNPSVSVYLTVLEAYPWESLEMASSASFKVASVAARNLTVTHPEK